MTRRPPPPPLPPGTRPRFWDAPEQFLVDAGFEGELLIARLRVALTAALTLVPVVNLAFGDPAERAHHLTGLWSNLLAFGLSLALYGAVRRDRRQRWLPLATALFDVTLITVTSVLFAFVGDPHMVVNSKITFDVYFLVLAATCLRFDRRVALASGLVAIAQFLAVVAWVAHAFPLDTVGGTSPYGRFLWSDQVSRAILLAAMTALTVVVVDKTARLRRESNSDALTGVFNRRFFDDYLHSEIARAARYAGSLTIAMVDVDHFKAYNDRFGHAAGDDALRLVARTIALGLRRSDIVARYGGEEFVLILREATPDAAMERLEAVREAIAATPLAECDEAIPRLTVSIGIAQWPVDGPDAADVLAEADRRLFQAKAAGRNRVVGPAGAPAPSLALA